MWAKSYQSEKENGPAAMDMTGQEFPKLGSAPKFPKQSKGKKQKEKRVPVVLQANVQDDVQSTPWAQIVRGRTPADDCKDTPSVGLGSSLEAVALCTPQAEPRTTAEATPQHPVAPAAQEPVANAATAQQSCASPLAPDGSAVEEPEQVVAEGEEGRPPAPPATMLPAPATPALPATSDPASSSAAAPSAAAAPSSTTAHADGVSKNHQPRRQPPAVLVHEEPQERQKHRLPKPSPKRASSHAHPSPPGSPEARLGGGRGLQPGASAHRHKKQTTGSDAREPRRQADGAGAGHGRSWQPARAVPRRCYFEDALPLRLPPGPALAALDHCLHGFVRRTVHQARQVDAPACALTERVQLEVSEIWPGARLACYGSRATGLACASSDVDLVVLGVPGLEGPPDMQAQLHALAALQARLERLPGVTSACIQKSAVPIVTLTAVSAAGAEDLHLDISLHTPQHSGLLAAQHVRQLHLVLPALQPLLLVLKQLLLHQQLKATYTGGLSSYALTVMTAHFLLDGSAGPGRGERRRPLLVVAHDSDALPPSGSREPPTTLATLLLACLHFFGEVFDGKKHAVCAGYGCTEDAALGGFVTREHRALEAFELHPILVCDPVCPTNNVAKGCYRIAQIQRVFQQAAGAAIAAANAAVDVASVAGSRDEPEALTLADASILAALNLK